MENNTNYYCNKCGRKFDLIDKIADFRIEKRLGYGTPYDGDILDFHVCCKCMEELINECTITPIYTGEGTDEI